MKKIIYLGISLSLLSTGFYSCKKKGCTDKNALNYSKEAKKDDGSCVTVEEIKSVVSSSQNVYVENFNMTFNSSSSNGSYSPSFNYQEGDMIMIETVNEYLEWVALPYIFDIDTHIEGSYEDNGTVWIYLKNDDGSNYYPSSNATVSFRVGLIKKQGLVENPNIKNMTISEILKK